MISIASPVIEQDEIQVVTEVLKSGKLAHGEVVEKFEEEFAKYIGTNFACAVNSGTAALHLALLACDIGQGDEVITTSFSFSATSNAILLTGAKPVFVDINPKTFNIDENKIEEKITEKTKVIIPVSLYGQPFNLDKINNIAKKYNLIVIEDNCQSCGSEYKGKKLGNGNISCFSFYPTKNLTTIEGGMITTNSLEIAEKIKILRNHGQKERYNCEMLGYNYRMTNISAAIGLCQLKKLDNFNNKRIENAQKYNKLLSNIKGIVIPHIQDNCKHIYHQYTILIKPKFGMSRNKLKQELFKKDIFTEIYYPKLIPEQDLYKNLGFNINNLEIAKSITTEILSLPIHPLISYEDIKYICNTIKIIRDNVYD